MTPQEAIARLLHRDSYLASKIAECEADGKHTFWFRQDRDALAMAISALEFLDATQQYEASQITA
jgi:hypothetical protein